MLPSQYVYSSFSICGIVLLLSGYLSGMISGDSTPWQYVAVIALSVPFTSIATLENGLINGTRDVRRLAFIMMFSALGSFCACIPLVYYLGFDGIILQIFTTALVAFALNRYFSGKALSGMRIRTELFRVRRAESSLLLRFSAFQLIGSMAYSAAIFACQVMVVRREGLASNGIFQSAWAVTWQYAGLALASIYMYGLPLMSASKSERDVEKQVNNSFRVLILLTTPVSCMIMIFSNEIIPILFSSQFNDAIWLLQVMILATSFRIISYPLSIRFVAKAYIKISIAGELIWCAAFAGLVAFSLPILGLHATGYAVLVSQILYFTFFLLASARVFHSGYTRKNLVALIASEILISSVLITSLAYGTWSLPIAGIGIAIWSIVVVNRTEWSWFWAKWPRVFRRSG